jgi:hypothetical protein
MGVEDTLDLALTSDRRSVTQSLLVPEPLLGPMIRFCFSFPLRGTLSDERTIMQCIIQFVSSQSRGGPTNIHYCPSKSMLPFRRFWRLPGTTVEVF